MIGAIHQCQTTAIMQSILGERSAEQLPRPKEPPGNASVRLCVDHLSITVPRMRGMIIGWCSAQNSRLL